MIGYKLIHGLSQPSSVKYAGGALIVAPWMVVNGLPEGTFHTNGFTRRVHGHDLRRRALWQIAYAPYVSDYTRWHAQGHRGPRGVLATYAGCVLGSTLPCCSVPRRRGLAELGHSRRDGDADPRRHHGVFIIFAVGVAATNLDGSLPWLAVDHHHWQNSSRGGNPPPSAVPSQLSSCSVSPRSPRPQRRELLWPTTPTSLPCCCAC